MNGEEFYEEFKTAIKALGLSFHDKEQINVLVVNGETLGTRLRFEADGRAYEILLESI